MPIPPITPPTQAVEAVANNATGARRVKLTTGDGITVYMDELDVPESVKKVLLQLDFEGDGDVTEGNLHNTVNVIKAMREGLDADGRGGVTFQEMMNGVDLLTNIKQASKNNTGDLDYTYFPEKVKEVMKEWDADGSGKVSCSELAAAAHAHNKIKQEGRLMKKIIIVMGIVIIALMVSMFVLSYLAVEMAKEMRGNSSGVMQNGAGEVVKIGSSDYIMENGKLVPRDSVDIGSGNTSRRLVGTDGVSQAVTMSTAQTTFSISSRMSNKMLTELTSFSLELKTGDSRLIRIGSWSRKPEPGAHHCGSVVVLKAEQGLFTLDDTDIFYDGLDEDILEKYGASSDEVIAAWKGDDDDMDKTRRLAETNGREPVRRLSEAARNGRIKGRRLSAAAMAGMYNSIADAAAEFSCVITMDDGSEVVITPPEPPTVPYTFVTEYEHRCIMGKEDRNVCFSQVDGTVGELRPGATKHSDGTVTMRTFQQVLMLADKQVMISTFPSSFMQRKVEVVDYISKKKRTYSLFGKMPNASEKLHCDLANMTAEELAAKDSKPIDLAYLGMVTDGGHTNYMRWSIGEKGEKARPGETAGAMELWEDSVTKVPYRMFMSGPTEIAPNVKASIFFSPMRVKGFRQNLTQAEINDWLKVGLDEDVVTPESTITDLIDACDNVGKVYVTGAEPQKVPTPSGAYGENSAFWYADRLTEMSAVDFEAVMEGPVGVSEHFSWPDSFSSYWRKLKAERKRLKEHKEILQAAQGCSPPARRLGNQVPSMSTFVLPTWISAVLFGPGSVLEFGKSDKCLFGRITKSTGNNKPKWANDLGVDIDVQCSLEYCWDPFSLDGEIFIQITKGTCQNLPWFVPKFNMVAAYLTGFFRIRGSSPIVENCQVKRHGELMGGIEIEALVGIYDNDDSGRPCRCSVCDPANWPNYGEDQKILCGCERFAPSKDDDRRRDYEHDYLGDDESTWKVGFDENRRRRRNDEQRRRRRRGGEDCTHCYQNGPAYNIGADINVQFSVKFKEFTPGSNGVDIEGSMSAVAKTRFLGYDFELQIVEDYTLFSINNAFQLGGKVCSRRLDATNTTEETVDDRTVANSWLCVDTCSHANDGHCDDGGDGSTFALCALGTDCNDCGTRAIE